VSGCERLRDAVQQVLDGELGDDVPAIRQLLMDALTGDDGDGRSASVGSTAAQGRMQYRVRWRREGTEYQEPYTAQRQYETLAAARRCVERQETACDDIAEWFRDEMGHTDWSRVPRPLIWGPVIEARPVGQWEAINGDLRGTTSPAHRRGSQDSEVLS